jgi:ClpP class serine protease
VWTGSQAKDIGLVDELGGLTKAMTVAKELAGFDVQKLYPVYRWKPEKMRLIDCLADTGTMLECFAQGSTEVFMPMQLLLQQLRFGLVPDQIIAWEKRLAKNPVQALWPDYLLGLQQ